MNYNNEMKTILENLDGNKLLLHSCCGPCSSSVIERLKSYFEITILFYNPNIEPKEEYLKRKKEQLKLLNELNIKHLDIDYSNEEFSSAVEGYENEQENGARCYLCYKLRLSKTSLIAKEEGFNYFGTTLTVSPHKNSKVINELGLKIAKEENINFLVADFKKEEGYKRSIDLAKKYNLYRQEYCGCRYSIKGDVE